jgi:putative sigma-54 modulation protein
MNLTYSGKTKEFTSDVEAKVGAKIAKLSKFIEQRGEREAHVCHSVERHLHKIEIIVNFYDHSLVAEGLDADLDAALCQAIEKLEKQVVKLRSRWRDMRRDQKGVRSTKEEWDIALPVNGNGTAHPAPSNGIARKPKIFRVNYSEDRKPMTVDEALLEMDGMDYFVYRDASRDCLSVLVRRVDGNFDLIEG